MSPPAATSRSPPPCVLIFTHACPHCLRISLASGANGAAATEAAATAATATTTTEAADAARANASAGETTAAAAADALFESRLAAATAGLPTLIVKIVKERLATLLLEKRMCFKNLREGRHGYKKKRALRNKVKRLRAQCTEAITIHNAWVDVSARLDADQLLSDSTSDTFPLQHLSSDTAPQSSAVPEAVREKAVRLSNVLQRAREDIVLRQAGRYKRTGPYSACWWVDLGLHQPWVTRGSARQALPHAMNVRLSPRAAART